MTLQNHSKLATYLALTAGFGGSATVSEGAVNAYVFSPGTVNDSSDSAYVPDGINIGFRYNGGKAYGTIYKNVLGSNSSYFAQGDNSVKFTDGSDLDAISSSRYGKYSNDGEPSQGATLGGSKNYANISFNGNDSSYEAVGEFVLDGAGGGYLTGLAIDSEGNALSISAGKAAIEGVPEPSSLTLFAFGFTGILARRNRRKAA